MNHKVTVIGTGRMGSALATALFKKGFATTVWNRTSSRTDPLARLGLRVAQSLLEAVNEADTVIVNIADFNSTLQLLQHPEIESALHGKTLVQLSSGSPDEAREMESWAQRCGIQYLDGAIWSYPMGIGTPQSTVLYSGSEELFDRLKQVLTAFGDNALFVGNKIGQASALDVAGLGVSVSMFFGFLQGYIVCEAENLPLNGFLQCFKGAMPVLEGAITDLPRRLQNKDYSGDQASLEAYSVVTRELASWCRGRAVDHSIPDAQLSLFDKAIKAGKGQADFAYLYEVLKAG